MSRTTRLSFLAVLIAFAAICRFVSIDHGVGFHPDERHMVMVAEKLDPRVTLNPESFAYGSFPYYLTRFTAEAVRLVWDRAVLYDGLFVVGRTLCILFGLLALPLTYWLGARIYKDYSVALLATFLLALNVLHVQLSHFFTVDVMLTTTALAAVCCMVLIAETGRAKWYLATGVLCGLSLGIKLSAMFLVFPFAVAVALDALGRKAYRSWELYALVMGTGALALLTFIGVEPYAVLDYDDFMRQNREQTSMARGLWRPPYTIQYVGTTPYIYPLKQMFWYTMGVLPALAVFAGFLYVCARQLIFVSGLSIASLTKAPKETIRAVLGVITYAPASELILLAWILALYGITAGFMVKYPRYLLPLYPMLFIFAAVALRDFGKAFASLMEAKIEKLAGVKSADNSKTI